MLKCILIKKKYSWTDSTTTLLYLKMKNQPWSWNLISSNLQHFPDWGCHISLLFSYIIIYNTVKMILMAHRDKRCGLLEISPNVYNGVQLPVFFPSHCLSFTLSHLSLTHTRNHLSPFEVTLHKETLVLRSAVLIYQLCNSGHSNT